MTTVNNALAKAHILAAQILAHEIEYASIYDIKEGLAVVALMKSITENKEWRYTQHRRVHVTCKSKHPGFVALVWGGRDCDGVQYSGQVEYVKATYEDVEKAINHTYEWADGPCNYVVMKPSDAAKVGYHSRDLTLEAFEEGHSHVLYA